MPKTSMDRRYMTEWMRQWSSSLDLRWRRRRRWQRQQTKRNRT